MARAGADVDTLGDVVVRSVVPICVSAVMMVAATAVLAFVSPVAALILLAALLVAGVLAPALAARAARIAENDGASARAAFSEAAVRALDHGAELRVAGRLDSTLASAAASNRASVSARDRAAVPGAFADAALPVSIGASVLGSLLVGIALFGPAGGTAGGMTPMALAVIVLVPLAAFEAASALPAAAVALTRARSAASRIVGLLELADAPPTGDARTRGLDVATAETSPTARLEGLPAGSRVALVGPSGAGKTTVLMGLAGLLPSAHVLDGARFFAEDAHVFETSILENLRVARGDVTADEAVEVLSTVGLGDWVEELPDGVDTTLVGGARAVSGGQRRRLLLARALLSDAPVLLLDEPTEHLDDASGAELTRQLLDRACGVVRADRSVVLVTHRLPPDTRADQVIELVGSPRE